MKKFRLEIYILILSFFLLNTSFAQNHVEGSSDIHDSEIIKTKSIGKIRLRMPIDDFLKLQLDNKTVKKELISLEGEDYDIYNIYENGEIVYAVEPDEKKVWRIWIYSNRIKTEKGLRIGDSLRDIREHYKIKDFVVAEGQISILLENYEYSFLLESAEVSENWWRNQKLETLNDNLKIELIII